MNELSIYGIMANWLRLCKGLLCHCRVPQGLVSSEFRALVERGLTNPSWTNWLRLCKGLLYSCRVPHGLAPSEFRAQVGQLALS